MFRCSVFRNDAVPVFRVPVFRCSGVPGFTSSRKNININDLHKSAFRSLGHIYITVNPCVHKMKVYINSGHCH